MKRIFFFTLIILALAVAANAQSFIGFGGALTHSTNSGDNRATFGGVYVEAGSKLPLNLELRVLGEYNHNASLPLLLTGPFGGSRSAIGDFHIRPEARFNFSSSNSEATLRPFAFAGAEYFRQRFYVIRSPEPLPLPPGPLPAYVEEDEHLPQAGLNPYVGAGLALGKSSEASYARLFTDTSGLNAAGLEGHRLAYSFKKPISKQWDLKLSGELDLVSFHGAEQYNYVAKIRLGFVLKK